LVQGLFGSLEFCAFNESKRKKACAKLAIIIANTTEKGNIRLATPKIIAKLTPKYSNILKKSKNFKSNNKQESDAQFGISPYLIQ
jgi:ribosomal protein S30